MRTVNRIYYALTGVILVFVINFSGMNIDPENSKIPVNTGMNDANSQYQTWVSLTVAESKRLIAKGLMNYPPVMEKLRSGHIVVTKGTTNTYFAEEFLGISLRSGEYVFGHILPAKSEVGIDRSITRQELVLKDGIIQDIPYAGVLDKMSSGDIIFKGANIINYQKGQAGVFIGSPTGGTTGVIVPKIKERDLRLIIPVGLEKDSGQDVNLLDRLSRIPHESVGNTMPRIWSIEGELFTEIEAILQFADVSVFHLASGGIGGAEGAVSLCIRGEEEEVKKALEVIRSIQGEPPFLR